MRLRTSSNASSVFSLDRSRPLQGKVAVITGASKGIGRAAALALANEGCRLVLVAAHSTNLLSGVAQDCVVLAAEVFEVVCDVRSEESVEDLLTVIKDKFGSVDILVNCAGIAQKGLVPSWQFSLEVLETDLVGLMRVTYKMLEVMKGPGSIVNIGSIASANIIGDGHGTADYSAAKAGVNAFSHCLFEKIRDQGIKCAVIHPGFVNTEMVEDVVLDHSKFIPPEDVAQAILFVCKSSPASCPVEIILRPQYSQQAPNSPLTSASPMASADPHR